MGTNCSGGCSPQPMKALWPEIPRITRSRWVLIPTDGGGCLQPMRTVSTGDSIVAIDPSKIADEVCFGLCFHALQTTFHALRSYTWAVKPLLTQNHSRTIHGLCAHSFEFGTISKVQRLLLFPPSNPATEPSNCLRHARFVGHVHKKLMYICVPCSCLRQDWSSPRNFRIG